MSPDHQRTARLLSATLSATMFVVACSGAPSTVAPTTTPTPIPTPACPPIAAQSGPLPSDRLTDLQVLGLPGVDIVRFSFGPPSLTPAGPPTGSLTTAEPPFSEAGSGRPIDLVGQHALQLVFTGMAIMNDLGEPTFSGQREIAVTDPARSLQHVVLFDESEGHVGWLLGYREASCVTLSREGSDVLVAIEFGPGVP